METLGRRIPPVVHWCAACDEYLNIPMNTDARGRRLGECPYCRVLLWGARPGQTTGYKGGRTAETRG